MSILLASVMFSSACSMKVLEQSGPPSALVDMDSMSVGFDYSEVGISKKKLSEQEWVDSRKKDEHREIFRATQAAANMAIVETLDKKMSTVEVAAGETGSSSIHANVRYQWWSEGLGAVVLSLPGRIYAQVDLTKDGEVVDSLMIKVQGHKFNPEKRFRKLGRRVGKMIHKHIKKTAGK